MSAVEMAEIELGPRLPTEARGGESQAVLEAVRGQLAGGLEPMEGIFRIAAESGLAEHERGPGRAQPAVGGRPVEQALPGGHGVGEPALVIRDGALEIISHLDRQAVGDRHARRQGRCRLPPRLLVLTGGAGGEAVLLEALAQLGMAGGQSRAAVRWHAALGERLRKIRGVGVRRLLEWIVPGLGLERIGGDLDAVDLVPQQTAGRLQEAIILAQDPIGEIGTAGPESERPGGDGQQHHGGAGGTAPGPRTEVKSQRSPPLELVKCSHHPIRGKPSVHAAVQGSERKDLLCV
jgi:hypothetical protein